MRDAAKPVRPSKRDVIVLDDDDSTNGQPLAKSVKREEPVPSSEVVKLQQENVKLQQEVAKKEDMFQRACRAARTAELRAEAAESRLDSKYGIKDGFNAEKKRADELEIRLAEVSSQLEEARGRAEATAQSEVEKEALKTQMYEMTKKYQDRIDHLTQELAEYQFMADVKPTMYSTGEDETSAVTFSPSDKSLKLHDTGHPTDIFQLCHPDSNESTSLDIACGDLRSAVEKLAGKSLDKEVVKSLPQLGSLAKVLHCEACDAWLSDHAIILHFISEKHYKKVSSLGAAVSTAALEYWLDKLKPVTIALLEQQLSVTQPVVGAVTSAANSTLCGLALHEIGHPTNILQLCNPDSSESMPLEVANRRLRSIMGKIRREYLVMNVKTYLINFREEWGYPEVVRTIAHCEACKVKTKRTKIIDHFLSSGHQKEVSALGADVSRAAFEYWLHKLETAMEVLGPEAAVANNVLSNVIGHPTNIFQLCSPNSSESTSFELARQEILSLAENLEGPSLLLKVQKQFLKFPGLNMTVHCELCEKTLSNSDFIMHFLSLKHQKKFGALGAAVSSAALEYWKGKLQA